MKTIYLATTAKCCRLHNVCGVSQNIAISRDITPAWPSIVLTPPPRRPQGDNHRVLLQLTIVNTLDNCRVMMPGFLAHSYQGPTQRSGVERWYGKTAGLTHSNQDAKSFSASIPRLIALMAEIFWFPLMQDFSHSLDTYSVSRPPTLGWWDDQVILTLCHLEPVCWINQRSAIQQGLAPLCSPLTACWLSLGIY